MSKNTGLRIQWAFCVTVSTILIYIFCLKFSSISSVIIQPQGPVFEASPSSHTSLPKDVGRLLEAIQTATWEAAGGQEPANMTEEEREEWMLLNPCRSQIELPLMYARRSGVRDMAENPLWSMVLEEYTKLHRTCMQRVGSNLTEAFLNRNTTKGCKFAIAGALPNGLSNRILSITSTILYAILTQRVVLVPSYTLLTTLMCEPFFGSSWNLDNYGGFSWYPGSEEAKHIWVYHRDMYAELDATRGMVNQTSTSYLNSSASRFFAVSMEHNLYNPFARFYCDREQSSFAGVTWLHFSGCIYIIPKFFSIPSFRRTLEALFPGRFVLTQLLRTVMLPSDSIWEQVMKSDAAHFNNTAGVRRVGIQIRYYYGHLEYEKMNDVVNDRILTCVVQNGILPPRTSYQAPDMTSLAVQAKASSDTVAAAPELGSRTPATQTDMTSLTVAPGTGNGRARRRLLEGLEKSTTQVFIASLYEGFHDHMVKVYLSQTPESGEDVTLIQLTNLQVQQSGVFVDTQSIVEIFLLSFSDTLVNTPISTFGGLAQAYGSLIPWMIQTAGYFTNYTADIAPCERDKTVDVCAQTEETKYFCAYDSNVNGLRIDDFAPYFQTCLANLSQAGVQLVTDYDREIYGSPETQEGLNAAVPNDVSKKTTIPLFSWRAHSSNEISILFFAGIVLAVLVLVTYFASPIEAVQR